MTMRVVCPWSLLFAVSAMAQNAPPPNQAVVNSAVNSRGDPAPVAPFVDLMPTRNVAGHGDFARYDTPGQCHAAVLLALRETVRDPDRDTLPGPQQVANPIPPAVLTLGTQCQARFPLATTTPRELQNTFALAVMLDDTARSTAALERWLAAPPTLADRDETAHETQAKRMSSAIRAYLPRELTGAQRAAHLARARALLTRLEALGQSVRNQRLAMQQFIMETEFHWKQQETGNYGDPRAVLQNDLQLVAGIDSAGGVEGAVPYGANGILLALELVNTRFLFDEKGVAAFADSVIRAHRNLGKLGDLFMALAQRASNAFGRPVAPLQAQFWYNTHGNAVWPVPGHVSLLLLGGIRVQDAAMLRRLMARYGPRGLQITVVDKTKGYWLRGGTETGPHTAAQEAAHDSTYYLGYLKIPASLAVFESTFARDSNGQVMQRDQVAYERDWRSGRMVLVDATGHLLFNVDANEPFLVAYLDRVMGLSSK